MTTSTAISGQGSVLQVGTGSGAAKAATAIQVGYPTILTIPAHGFSGGDNLALSGFAGADAALLNGLSKSAKNITTNTVAVDVDTTGKTITIGANQVTPTAYTGVANFKNFSGFDGEASESDVTHLGSDAKEVVLGLVDNGKFNIDVDWDGTDAGQQALLAARNSGQKKNFKLILPNGKTASWAGYVKSFPVSLGVDQSIKSTIGFRISGPVTWS